ncbi:MAG: hypothetical protein K2K98_06065 [Muribaculaceae bacterium]|nr:hypothetical protein [Muribaculaceae bacterium]
MKKILLSLAALSLCLSGIAAPSYTEGSRMTKRLEARNFVTPEKVKTPSSLRKIAPGLGSMTDIITSVEGEKVDVTVTTSGITMSGFGLMEFEDQMLASHMVYGADNEVYIYEMFTYLPTQSYVKGVKDGDKIIVDLPQAIYYDDDPDLGLPEAYYLTVLSMREDGWYWPEEKSTLTLTIDAYGDMNAEGLSPDVILGVADSEDGTWIGLGAWDVSISEFTDSPVSVPDGIQVSEDYWTSVGDGYGWQVNFAESGTDVWFQGLSDRIPQAWIKGTVATEDGETVVSIAQDQYVGDFMGYHIFTKCVEMTVDDKGNIFYENLMDPSYEFKLVWDRDKNTMVAKDKDVVLLFNTSKKDIYFINDLIDMNLIRQESYEGVPRDPAALDFEDVMAEEGYSIFSFDLPGMSIDGNYLLIDDLAYVVYVDGEEWTFDAEEYDMEDSLVEIPWTFDGNWIIRGFESTEHKIAFFVEGITTLGVQSIYRHGGNETRSEIVTINVDEIEAVEGISADRKVSKVTYYDIAGREVQVPEKGTFLKVSKMSDGSILTEKLLR